MAANNQTSIKSKWVAGKSVTICTKLVHVLYLSSYCGVKKKWKGLITFVISIQFLPRKGTVFRNIQMTDS